MNLDRIRNVGIVAHIDAGKTTVTERILFYCGVEHRMGEVHDGTTVMDWMEEERERGITITAAATVCPWQGNEIRILDTPGHVDFTAEVARSLRVLDGAVVLLDAVAGVQAQTETVMRQADNFRIPRMVFVNKMDRQGADFQMAIESIRNRLGSLPLPVQMPAGEGSGFEGIVDLVGMRYFTWSEEDLGAQAREGPIPDALVSKATEARLALCADVAEVGEDLTDAYLENENLGAEELMEGIRRGTLEGRFVPVLCGAALRNQGIQPLLDGIVAWLPSPGDRPPVEAVPASGEGDPIPLPPEPGGPLAALVFKIFHEPHGALFYARVYSGTLKASSKVLLSRTGRMERINQLYCMHANDRESIDSAGPGDIVAIPGLKEARTGDTLCGEEAFHLEPVEFPEPVIQRTVEPYDPSEREKLEEAVATLAREDPTLRVTVDEENGQIILSGMGELHLEVAVHRLERDFRARARVGRPRVAFRETLASTAEREGVAECPMDGGGRQRVVAKVALEPGSEGSLELNSGGISAELRPLFEEGDWGGIAGDLGFPVVDVRATLRSLEHSPSDAPLPPALAMGAVHQAISRGLQGNTKVLEPVMALRVEVPEEFLSGVMADLNARGAEVQDLEVDTELRRIRARVPLGDMFSYSTQLRSLTQGRGNFALEPAGYAPVGPARLAELTGS
jgi:elongation factor G